MRTRPGHCRLSGSSTGSSGILEGRSSKSCVASFRLEQGDTVIGRGIMISPACSRRISSCFTGARRRSPSVIIPNSMRCWCTTQAARGRGDGLGLGLQDRPSPRGPIFNEFRARRFHNFHPIMGRCARQACRLLTFGPTKQPKPKTQLIFASFDNPIASKGLSSSHFRTISRACSPTRR